MPRNYEGEKLCRQWLLDGFEDSYLENRSEYSEEEQKRYDSNIMLYWKDVFNAEFNYEYNKKRHPNLQDRIEAYYLTLPNLGIPAYHYELEKLHDEWGYKTDIQKWDENFYSVLAKRTLQLLNKFKVNYFDLI